MSILSQLLHRQITFQTAAHQAEQWASQMVAKDPALAQAGQILLSDAKQAFSNAVDMAESVLSSHAAAIALAAETALEAELAVITKGASLPFNPLITKGIDDLVNVAIAAAQSWGMKTKAALGTVPAVPADHPA